jgi:hypothetical protein
MAAAAEPPSAAQIIAQKFAEDSASTPAKPAKTPKPAIQAAQAERPPLDYEMDMLRRARAEQAAAKAATPAAAALPPAATPAPVVPPTAATPVAPPATVTKAAETAPSPTPKTEVEAKAETKSTEPALKPETTGGPAPHATLLLAFETSGDSRKSGPSPIYDPLICMGDACYVSAGFNADAVALSKTDALKLKSTTDASQDSCKGELGCVFRNVPVPKGAQVQVIELGTASSDPVRASDAQLDPTCKMSDGDLNCDNPIHTVDYKIWLVPEETARSVGAQELEEALADGLPHDDEARASDK